VKVVIDNNVIVDALLPNKAFGTEAQEILRRASMKEIDGFVGANSLTDIFYVLRKEHGTDDTKEMLRRLLVILDIIGLEPEDCARALASPMPDFEDAVVEVCAKKIGADCIVTRDAAFIKAASEVKVVSPAELLANMN
jgi:predicted nucleic acid-binding protein